MQLLLTCPACSEVVRIRTEDAVSIPRCPRCGHRFPAISIAEDEPIGAGSRIDDTIISWLSQSPASAGGDSVGDVTCQMCGYAGMIRGDALCPVCREVNPSQSPPAPPTVDCPNCGQAIDLMETGRGKTTICPGCKYFLGCILPATKPSRRKLGIRR